MYPKFLEALQPGRKTGIIVLVLLALAINVAWYGLSAKADDETSAVTGPVASDARPYTGPIIDVQLHALPIDFQGPPPVGICVGQAANLKFDATQPWGAKLFWHVKNPVCENPIWSPETWLELRNQTVAELKKHKVFAVVSGPIDLVEEQVALLPEQMAKGIELNFKKYGYSLEKVESLLRDHDYRVLGEITDMYDGIAPNDPRFDDYFKLAVKYDVPIAFHMGIGPPGAPLLGENKLRAHMHSPLSLEEALVKYPQMRVHIMHAAWPMLEDLKSILYNYPQVYVDTGSLQFAIPRKEFYNFIEGLFDAGFGDRVMYGTDQMVWPGLIEEGISAINEAPFLTYEQKKDILHDNAARFMRIKHPLNTETDE